MDAFNWDAARFFVDVLYIMGLVGVAIYAFVTNRSKLNAGAIVGMDAKLDDHEVRIVRLEEYDQHAPNRDDIERLHSRVSNVKDAVGDVATTVGALAEAVGGLKKSVDLLNKHHMEGGRK